MLRSTERGAILLLFLVAACSAAQSLDENEVNAILMRERRTYGHYQRSCGRPGYPQNGWSVYRGTTPGSKVIHYCKSGYLLVGAKLRICQNNGRWTPSLPQCRLVDCGDPGEPANGKKWLRSTTLGCYVKYKCNYGFKLVGHSYRKCLSSGSWSGQLPTCRAVGCAALSHPRYGKVTVSGSTATYSCTQGYILRGNGTRTCVGGVWQGRKPECQEINCGRLRSPNNGAVKVKGTSYRSIARYWCDYGYVLRGVVTRTCEANGKWSGEPPTCNARECPRLRNIVKGSVQYKSRSIGSIATYRCNTGYVLQGKRQRTCLDGGEWSGEEPSCQVVQCPSLSSPSNGRVRVSGRTPGSEARYSCNEGYQLEGSVTRRCLNEGVWSSQEPICIAILCPGLTNPTNGAVTLSGRSPGSRARYSCRDGFTLEGVERRTCQNNGEWTDKPPVCIAILCPDLRDPDNGQVTVTGNTPTSTATYVCDSGYLLDGVETRVCQNNGRWSDRPPVCRALLCPALSNPANGRVTVTTRSIGSVATYSCNQGYSLEGDESRTCEEIKSTAVWSSQEPRCVPILCPDLSDPDNGQVFVTGNTPTSTANYVCDSGYLLDGVETRVCQSNGRWSDRPPVCRVLLCPALSNPANGRVTVTTRSIGSVATYSCNEGYSLEGDESRTCEEIESRAVWFSQEPRCVPILCPSLRDPDNGQVFVTGNTPTSTANYVCDSGYLLDGVETRVCQSNGRWSDRPPVCRVLLCPALSNPANGRVTVTTRSIGSVATYSCNQGYSLEGDESRTCEEIKSTAVWSSQEPRCVPILCPDLSDPSNGQVFVTGNTPSSTANYICDSGYLLDGVETRVCQSNGRWSDRPPVCRVLLCPALTSPPNGRVTVTTRSIGSVATYSCNEGYSLEGDESRTCTEIESTAVWSSQEPRCVPIRCPRLFAPANGNVQAPLRTLGSQATYTCNDGYTLEGTRLRICQSNGEWTEEAPICVVVNCGDLSDIPNGQVRLSTTTFGSTATYTCDPGFSIVGTSTRTCMASGFWSGREPTCTPSSCGSLDNPTNGVVTITGSTIGARASYTCNRGYILVGVALRVCLSTGQWSGTIPTCEAITCPNLQSPSNGNVQLSGVVYTSIASYSCNSGYILVGEVTRTCQDNGVWSGVPPICQPVQCEQLEFPENGQVIQRGNQVGATATYSCFPGYLIFGESTRTCQRSGEWSGEPPICEPVDCGNPPSIQFGDVTFTTTTFGSQASYTCQKGYVIIGAFIRTCQIDGTWSGEDPTCQVFTCDSLFDPLNGEVFTTGFEVGDTATYVCKEGFTLVGNSTRVCQRNGQWSGIEPICQGVTCPRLTSPDNGLVQVRGFSVGSIATYRCIPGFVLRGSQQRECQSSGEWSGRDPTCEMVDCPDLPDPVNGEVTISGNIFLSTASYRCDLGYGLVGVSVRVCQANGTWSAEAPICQISTCSNLEPPQNGNIRTTSTQFGGLATYYCNEGYELVGNEVRICQSNGFWNGTAPFCIIVMCDFLNRPKDGSVTFTSTTFGAEARYACNPGYRLEGVEIRTCQANGEWSDEKPSCTRISCELLEAPKNGDISFSQGTLFGSIATYTCDIPFQLVGVFTRVCQATGKWSGDIPVCESIRCKELESPENGTVDVSSRLPGSTATYSCYEGYNLIGSQTRSCQNNGFWTGVDPFCQLADCGTLKPPNNGDVTLSGTTIGSTATYECFVGFVLVDGDEIRTCVDGGYWSGVQPFCNPVDCGTLNGIPNGYVEVDGTSLGSTATYICNSGYVLMGAKGIRQCMENGEWSGEEPRCEVVDCGGLTSPVNGRVVVSGTTFGFTATYSCNVGFTLNGLVTRVCQITGNWSGDAPICFANQCPDLPNPARGSVTLTGLEYLDTATYSCDSGYVLSGVRVRTCQSNGVWSGDTPSCVDVDCGQPPFLQNGQFTYSTGTSAGSQAVYSCFRGYRLIGSSTRTCLTTGLWSQEVITCEIINCGDLSQIPNGDVTFSSTVIDSQARYSCDSGYELVGVEVRICQENGQWSSQEPFCILRQVFTCPQLNPPTNGEVSISGGLVAGSIARYSCNDGYRLVGIASRRCIDQQGWSGSAPACQPVDCGDLAAPRNGQVMLMGTTFGSRVHYSCNPGYILLGSVTRTCESDGIWSGSDPRCSAVECGGLPNPVNGFVTLTGENLGSVATYSCQTGYSLRGSTTRECGLNGQWTGIAPTCESTTPDDCGDPGTPAFGTRFGNDFRVGATVYYECNSGYVLEGSESRRCQASGIWTGRLPQCVEIIKTCEEGATVYDDCRRRCTCRGGSLVDCCRVRYDYASLSISDRQRYIQTVLTVATQPQYRAQYQALVAQYKGSFDTLAQDTNPSESQFFAWNRYYLLQYENLLQQVDCRVTIPYWDWTVFPMSPYLAEVWNPSSGFGDSARSKDGCVENGPFRVDVFEVSSGGCLRRDYRMQMFPTRAIIEQDLLTLSDEEFNQFHQFLQIFIHINVICFVGGQMCSNDSADDPVYLLHLAQVDSIYTRWQEIDSARFSVAIVNDNRQLVQTGSQQFLVSNFGDISDLPNGNSICYEPAEFKTHIPASMGFMADSLRQMTEDSDLQMTCVSDEDMKQLPMSPAATDFMHRECGYSH